MAILKLMRPDEKENRLAEMVVYLNGAPLGSLLNNESKEVDIAAGQHTLKAKIGSQGSKVYKFTITTSQTKAFVLVTEKGANNPEPLVSGTLLDFIIVPLQLLYYFTIGHNRYLSISELKLK
jgi:hypothetical protein